MPGFIAHYALGQEVYQSLNKIDDHVAIHAIKRHPHVFALGTQGPDLFFYYPRCIFSKKLKHLGNRMHTEHTGDFLLHCIRRIRQEKDPKRKEIFLAYVSGFLCHYKLDTLSHPYIYTKSKYQDFTKADKPHYTTYHCTLETYIDSNICLRYLEKQPRAFHTDRAIIMTKEEADILGSMLAPCINSIYFDHRKCIYADQISASVWLMALESRILWDPTGLKRKVCKKIENTILGYPLLTCLIPLCKADTSKDYLNLRHKDWCSPWETEIRTESFLDLFEMAKEKSITTLHLLDQYLGNSINESDLTAEISNLSYNSGLPL